MAVNFPTVTGYQGYWSLTGDFSPYSPIARAQEGWRSRLEPQIARLLDKPEMREVKALFGALLGAAVGGNATSTYSRVGNPVGASAAVPVAIDNINLGGVRTIDTVTVINRNTTATDLAYLKDIASLSTFEARSITYPVDLGNGGGGKLGF